MILFRQKQAVIKESLFNIAVKGKSRKNLRQKMSSGDLTCVTCNVHDWSGHEAPQ